MSLYIRRTGSRLHRVYRPSSLTGWSTLSSLASSVGSSKFYNPERLREALNSFDRQNTRIGTDTCASLLQGCAKTKCLTEGRRVHNLIVKNGLQNNRFLGDLLVNMYAKCGSLFEARSLFDNLSKRSVFLWTSLIAAYVHRGQGREALRLFKQMQQEGVEPDKFTFTSIVGACSSPSDLEDGRRIHAQISDSGYDADVVLGNAIITMYGKCGSTDDALKAFLTMANRDVVTWNSVIIAHGQSGRRKDAQKLFREMIIKGAGPDEFTFSSILHACCGVEDKAEGKLIHARAIDKGYVSDIVVGNALVNMYNKCKSLEDARRVFDNKCERNLVSWNTIISACAQHGCGKDSLELFSQLQESGLKPNKFILASILNACATPTLIDQGKA